MSRCSQEDSNLRCQLRGLASYPLDHGSVRGGPRCRPWYAEATVLQVSPVLPSTDSVDLRLGDAERVSEHRTADAVS